ncbi:SOS response-associated peptidase family protein [Streptomyces sp. ISL-43]|nr:SOS response-associated peptidase family protein [Streptomyces sp. ISL-43]
MIAETVVAPEVGPGCALTGGVWWSYCDERKVTPAGRAGLITTTEATDTVCRIHPRMPLALEPGGYDAWIDPAHHDTDDLRALLHTPAEGRLAVTAVTTAVNNVRNNGPHLLEPANPWNLLQLQGHPEGRCETCTAPAVRGNPARGTDPR